MVGFEDSVNMAEECTGPAAIFPSMMLTGLGITGVIYMLVAISASRPAGQIGEPTNAEAGADPTWSRSARPTCPFDKLFPFLSIFAVANTALINMLMASRLIYGMAHQDVLPRSLGKVLRGPPLAVDGDPLHHAPGAGPDQRRARQRLRVVGASPGPARGTTALLLLASSRSSTSPA